MTPRPPAGTELVGDYHNHTTVLTFSELDLNTRQRTPFYLCVPDESVLKHDPTTGNTRKIGP
jgi:proteasome lid subunit RPN8/RPN11